MKSQIKHSLSKLQELVCDTIHLLLEYMGSTFKEFFHIVNPTSRSWVDNEEKFLESASHIVQSTSTADESHSAG